MMSTRKSRVRDDINVKKLKVVTFAELGEYNTSIKTVYYRDQSTNKEYVIIVAIEITAPKTVIKRFDITKDEYKVLKVLPESYLQKTMQRRLMYIIIITELLKVCTCKNLRC